MRKRIHLWLWWRWEKYTDWVYDNSKPDWMYLEPLNEVVQRIWCFLLGHLVVADHCGMPEHDYCWTCMTSKPHQAHQTGRST